MSSLVLILDAIDALSTEAVVCLSAGTLAAILVVDRLAWGRA